MLRRGSFFAAATFFFVFSLLKDIKYIYYIVLKLRIVVEVWLVKVGVVATTTTSQAAIVQYIVPKNEKSEENCEYI